MSNIAYQLRRLLDGTALDEVKQHQLSGRLSRRYGAIARGDEDVFTRKLEADGIESTVFIAVDESESMDERMPAGGDLKIRKATVAADAVLALSDALRRCTGTKYMVAKFSDREGGTRNGTWTPDNEFNQQTVWRIFKKWHEQHGKLVGREEQLRKVNGGTPDLAALQDALVLLDQRPEPRKVLLFIGDGDGYNSTAARLLQEKYPNIIVIGIGLASSPDHLNTLRASFKNCLPITCANDLGGAAMAAIVKSITR
jgi:hypothetical protein